MGWRNGKWPLMKLRNKDILVLRKYREAHRPPIHLRNELDLDFNINEQSVEIIYIRPEYGAPSQKMIIPVAKVCKK